MNFYWSSTCYKLILGITRWWVTRQFARLFNFFCSSSRWSGPMIQSWSSAWTPTPPSFHHTCGIGCLAPPQSPAIRATVLSSTSVSRRAVISFTGSERGDLERFPSSISVSGRAVIDLTGREGAWFCQIYVCQPLTGQRWAWKTWTCQLSIYLCNWKRHSLKYWTFHLWEMHE